MYVLLRATLRPISSAEVVANLARSGLIYSPAEVSRIMRTLERKGYLAKPVTTNVNQMNAPYRVTAQGSEIAGRLRERVGELFTQ
jgi:hypothetical protein